MSALWASSSHAKVSFESSFSTSACISKTISSKVFFSPASFSFHPFGRIVSSQQSLNCKLCWVDAGQESWDQPSRYYGKTCITKNINRFNFTQMQTVYTCPDMTVFVFWKISKKVFNWYSPMKKYLKTLHNLYWNNITRPWSKTKCRPLVQLIGKGLGVDRTMVKTAVCNTGLTYFIWIPELEMILTKLIKDDIKRHGLIRTRGWVKILGF